MSGVAARRALQVVPTFLGSSMLVHWLFYVFPGDPIRALFLHTPPDPEKLALLRGAYHLDDPYLVQYGFWLRRLLTGDLGRTFTGLEVSDLVASSAPTTLKLIAVALAFQLVVGVGAGVAAGRRAGSWLDTVVFLASVLGASVPVFIVAWGVRRALPGYTPPPPGAWAGYALPGFVLASTSLVAVARMTRTGLVRTLRADYVRLAVAKGMPPGRVVGVHALRNCLPAVLTLIGAEAGTLFGAAVVVEGVFGLPGLGGQLQHALFWHEGLVASGIVMVLLTVVILANLAVDLLYSALDPRVRAG